MLNTFRSKSTIMYVITNILTENPPHWSSFIKCSLQATFEKTVYSIVVGSGKKGFNSSYTQQTINMKEDVLQAAIASGRAEMGAT